MKIANFKINISPEIGCSIAGYSLNDISVAKLDDLYACGLCVDDGQNKILIISFDLLGLDQEYIQEVRQECANILKVRTSDVLLTCTHTHTGPDSRTLARKPEHTNFKYLAELKAKVYDAVANLKDFRECYATFYSSKCDENRNRRYTTADNHASFTPHRREVLPCADGFADKELGQLFFFDSENHLPVYAVGNYAAHPLAGHAPGLGGLRISADYPGAFRDYITENTGAECMFISGAAGDMVPREDELGTDAIKTMGKNLAKAAIGGMIDSQRNPNRFKMTDAKVGSIIKTFEVRFRNKYLNNQGALPPVCRGTEKWTLEIQCVSIGNICFVGVPGELTAELGQEIKWNSPFRRAFIAYNSTAYFDYIVPVNLMVAGGYEGSAQRFRSRDSFKLLTAAVDAMFDLREAVFASESDEPYPDNVVTPLVNIPKN
ncbi:MAG: hypothetical protein IKB77_05535 [Lentisphaeria bacterium]|nr:hypothetical protein [Lentisphaeria bacterium]